MNWGHKNGMFLRGLAMIFAITVGTAVAHDRDDEGDDAAEAALQHAKHSGIAKPIIETHIHFYQVSRPGGVPWPTPADGPIIYRDVLPPEYSALARIHGIVSAGIVEASEIVEDNQWILDLVRGDRFYSRYVGNLEIGAPTFAANLARFSRDPRWVGIRGYLTGPAEGITLSPAQLASLRDLARRGMSLDILSRGDATPTPKNPKPLVEALCQAVPDLRIIIDHLAGAQGVNPTPAWELSIRRLADLCPNLYIKFSSFYDMFQTDPQQWNAPTDLASYEPTFDVLMSAFGPDRLIWGSNWPVSDQGGSFANQIKIAEQYLAQFGTKVRDKVMFKNALMFYRRHTN